MPLPLVIVFKRLQRYLYESWRRDGEETAKMTTIRVKSSTWLILVLVPLMIIGCQLGFGAQPALPSSMGLTKVIYGYLQVQYFPPCEIVPSPAEWVAPMKLTDLRSGSFVYLNRDGILKQSPKPDYKTDEGKATLEAALKNSSVMEQVVERPECP